MAPVKPHWVQPSHPDVQEVIVNKAAFTTKSISKIALPPFGLFAKLDFPPCTVAPEPTYATVQMGRDKHLDLNSDLLYINHSCEPSLVSSYLFREEIFDTSSMNVIAGPKGLKPGDELTFFYPSTEWHMAQPFDCLCGTPTCRGRIAGARDMAPAQLEGLWLNRHIRDLLEERDAGGSLKAKQHQVTGNGAVALPPNGAHGTNSTNGTNRGANGVGSVAKTDSTHAPAGAQRRGPTSRELGGEMGGDTTVPV